MAYNDYTGSGGVWSTGGDWTGGVPDDTDTIRITQLGNGVTMTSLPDDSGDIDYVGFETGPRVLGAIGTPSSPLFLGSVTSTIVINSPLSQGIHLAVGTGKACTIQILGCPQALTITGPGTWTTVYAEAPSGTLQIGSAPVTTLWNTNGMRAIYAAGATLGTLYQHGNGSADLYCAIGTRAEITRGAVNLLGTTDQTHALAEVWGGRLFFSSPAAPTLTQGYVDGGGVIDFSGGSGKVITATVRAFAGGRIVKPAVAAALALTLTGIPDITSASAGGYGAAA